MTDFTATLETVLETALRNGMTFNQIKARIPEVVAKRCALTVPEFHATLDRMGDPQMFAVVDRVVARFTPADRAAIARKQR